MERDKRDMERDITGKGKIICVLNCSEGIEESSLLGFPVLTDLTNQLRGYASISVVLSRYLSTDEHKPA